MLDSPLLAVVLVYVIETMAKAFCVAALLGFVMDAHCDAILRP